MGSLLAAVIAGQFGLVTRTQARSAGLSDKAIRWRVESGRWLRVHPGVYSTTPGRRDWDSTALAALLHVGLPSALCGPSAGYAWGLLERPPDRTHVVVPVTRRPCPRPGVVLHRSRHALERTSETAWPHRTTIEHTVFDLALGEPLDTAVSLIARACSSGQTSARNLRMALDQRPNQGNRLVLAEVIADVAGGVESAAERRYVRDVEEAHGLPRGLRQQPGPGSKRRDNAYEEVKVIVEVDGRAGHAGWRAQQRDGRRDRETAGTGRLTVRAFWPDVHGGQCRFALELEEIFRRRGWTGRVSPCHRPDCAVRRRRHP